MPAIEQPNSPPVSPWAEGMAVPPPKPLFEADLIPHRSLSRAGFVGLMSVLAALSFVAGLAFYTIGAWPVIGFLGLDIALIYFAFRLNYAHGRMCERIRLDPGRLSIERIWPDGRRQAWLLEPYWTRIETAGEEGEAARLLIICRAQRVALGGFLSASERSAFAGALKTALSRANT